MSGIEITENLFLQNYGLMMEEKISLLLFIMPAFEIEPDGYSAVSISLKGEISNVFSSFMLLFPT